MSKKKRTLLIIVLLVVVVLLTWWLWPERPAQDEAMAAGLTVEDFRQAPDEPDYFAAADGGIELTRAEVRGRNTWWVWTGGNQAFWDYLANHSFGTFDLLKTASSFPCSPEQEEEARRYEANLVRASGDGEYGTPGEYGYDDAGYGGGEYGEGAYGTPPGGYGDSYDTGYQGVCEAAMYPEPGKPPYRYYRRDSRFCYTGLINEPGFETPAQPDEWGLCLDSPSTSQDPFDEAVYGRPSGIMGLRLFDNPAFFEGKNADKHQRRWREAMERNAFYLDPDFFNDPKLVRPYRVGMSCGFCHISHHPLHPPADPESPRFAEMSGTIGAQYFWFGRIFGANLTPDNFAWHLLDAQLPGAVDTSFVPADNINNPRAMNAVFDVPARLAAGGRFHHESIDGGALDLPEVQRHLSDDGETASFGVPMILWDGADSVGIDAALTRVYINIGEYHQEWIRHIRPIIGGRPQTPITVEAAQENSVFWNATQERAGDMASYLIRAGYAYRLADVAQPAGTAVEEAEAAAEGEAPEDGGAAASAAGGVERGKVVFAENCARCHSSKQPPDLPGLDEGLACAGESYLECWQRFWKHTETPAFKQAMAEIVLADDFLEDNYLSTDARVPVHQPLAEWTAPELDAATLARYRDETSRRGVEISDTLIGHLERSRLRGLATGALESEICSAMATNALEGHVWDNFASRSYKTLPAVGTVELYDPVSDRVFDWETPGGGRGYQRVPSLVGIWSTAPFLHNNEVGVFTSDPSLAGRLAAFDDGIRELLWPERRDHSVSRTSDWTYVKASTRVLPAIARPIIYLSGLVEDGNVQVGPVPKGTPVNLLANLNVDSSDPRFSVWRLLGLVRGLGGDLKRIRREQLSHEEASALLRQHVPKLIELSNCPDFIADRGHYFGTQLSDEDKEALIAFVKTF
jgi:mono/diheme cytochrome c family protein